MKEHFLGMAHISINTEDMEKSIAFYRTLGASVTTRDVLHKPEGDKLFALLDFCGATLELTQDPGPASMVEGVIPHFAMYVDDVEQTVADIRAAGIDTFLAPEKKVLSLFGGVAVWFFTGPSGEQIELMQRL